MPAPAKRTLLFMHVPKTGGAVLTGVLGNRFAADDCLPLYFGPKPDLSDVDRYRYVSGHLDAAFLEHFERPPFVLTLLRDPIERALSAYFFARSFPADYELPRTPRVGWGGDEAGEIAREWWRLVPKYDLGELISSAPEVARQILGNRQARTLAPCPPGEESLADATAALEQCDFVGLTNHLDESLEWLTRRLGWRSLLPLPRSNVSGGRSSRQEVSGETMEALARLTEIDRELFARGSERYESQVDEWKALGDPRDPSADIPDASAVSDLRFDRAIPGGGWMNREQPADGTAFCWMGSTRRAWVEMVAERGTGRLDIEIPHALNQEVLEGLQVAIDDQVVPHLFSEAAGVVVATVPVRRPRFRRRRIIVSVELDRIGHPQDVDPDSLDRRELGIAVSRMSLRPA